MSHFQEGDFGRTSQGQLGFYWDIQHLPYTPVQRMEDVQLIECVIHQRLLKTL